MTMRRIGVMQEVTAANKRALKGEKYEFEAEKGRAERAATVAVIQRETVIVRSPQVPQPVAVRYAWTNAPVAALRSRAGLPAAPFRTDDWPGVTDDAFLHKWVGG